MSKINSHKPMQCAICGRYLTTIDKYTGNRCFDPSHWQAAGLLASSDFYPMARLAAQANAELNLRFDHQNGSHSGVIV
jgi:hypothetical protein